MKKQTTLIVACGIALIVIPIFFISVSCVSDKNRNDIVIEKVPLKIDDCDYYLKSFKNSSNCLEIPNAKHIPVCWSCDYDDWYKFVIDSRFVIILCSHSGELSNYYLIFERNVLIGYFFTQICDNVEIIKNNKGNIIIIEKTEYDTVDAEEYEEDFGFIRNDKRICFFESINSKDYLRIYENYQLFMPGDSIYYNVDSEIKLIDNSAVYEIQITVTNIFNKNKYTDKRLLELKSLNSYEIEPVLLIKNEIVCEQHSKEYEKCINKK